MFIHYFRTTADGRVLMGSGGGPIGHGGRLDDGRFSGDRAAAARAEEGLRRLLPALAGVRVERAWGGPIDVSADQLPFFGTVDGDARPLRRRLLGPRRRAELARRADPRVARAAPRRRMEQLPARSHAARPRSRRSRSSGWAAGSSARRCSPSRTRRSKDAAAPLVARAIAALPAAPADAARHALTHCATIFAPRLNFAQHRGMLAPVFRRFSGFETRKRQSEQPWRVASPFSSAARSRDPHRSTGSTGS